MISRIAGVQIRLSQWGGVTPNRCVQRTRVKQGGASLASWSCAADAGRWAS
jgi:hypothetical protein